MPLDLIVALHEFVEMFEARGYRYAIMGGIAARVLGIPRPTYDVDFTLAVARDQLPELFDAAENAGYHVPVAYRSGRVDTVANMPMARRRPWRGIFGAVIRIRGSRSPCASCWPPSSRPRSSASA